MVNELKKRLGTDNFFNGHGLFSFDAREVVEVAPDVVVAALMKVNVFFYSDNQVVEIPCRDFQLLQFDGSLNDGLSLKGEALRLQRAVETVGVLGSAMQRAELHHGLVVKSRLFTVEEGVCSLGEKRLSLIIINRCVNVE